jgi:hypothetical protein
MGLGVVLMETATPRGWGAGLVTLVNLVPLGLATVLGGPVAAALAAAVAVTGGALALGGAGAAVIALKHVLPGLALGVGVGRRLPVALTALLSALASLAGLAVLLWLLAPPGVTPLGHLDRQIAAHVADLERWPARFGVGGDPGWATEAARVVAATMRAAGPGLIALGVFAVALANYAVLRACLRGRGLRPFAEEAVPDHLVWAAIGAGALVVTRHPSLEMLGVNVLLVLVPVYAIQGLAVLRHFFVRLEVPRLLQVVSFGLLAMQPLLLLAVACVGLSDLWIDFRKIRQAPTAA